LTSRRSSFSPWTVSEYGREHEREDAARDYKREHDPGPRGAPRTRGRLRAPGRLRLCSWAASVSTSIQRTGVDSGDLAALTAWVNGLSAFSGGTDFEAPIADAVSWFGTSPTPNVRRVLAFVTDGEPWPASSVGDAVVTGADIIDRTSGEFSDANDTAVEIYGVNIDLSDTTYTAMLDNTPEDGVPVVDGSDPDALKNILLAVMGPVSAMNPATIIYECLTNSEWGLGYAAADIDDDFFEAAADQLYSEGLGIAILWDRQATCEDFIGEIMRHIDAALYVDRTTGKFCLKLIRDDYDESGLLQLDPSNVIRVEDFRRPTLAELVNSVTVNYWDAVTGNTGSLTLSDTALISVQGGVVGATLDYMGLPSQGLGARIAGRDLKALSYPVASAVVYATRAAAGLNIGDCFRLSWPDLGVDEITMRVKDLAFGDGRNNQVRIVCVEDIFALPTFSLVSSSPPLWTDPSLVRPPAMDEAVVLEAPYFAMLEELGPTDTETLLTTDPDAGLLLVAGMNPGGAINADFYVDAGEGYDYVGPIEFCPGAVLAAALAREAGPSTVAIEDGIDLDLVETGTLAQIGAELVRIDAVSADSLTIGRGCLDTTPAAHAAGSVVVFWGEHFYGDEDVHTATDTLGVKLCPVSFMGPLALSAATEVSVTMAARAYRPYPPAKLQFNAEYFPAALALDENDEVVVSWEPRNRITQGDGALLDFTEDGVAAETGTTYTLQIVDSVTLIEQLLVEDIATESYTLTQAALAGMEDRLLVQVWAVRDGVESWQAAQAVVENNYSTLIWQDWSEACAFTTGA
jgi:hypothetical protein